MVLVRVSVSRTVSNAPSASRVRVVAAPIPGPGSCTGSSGLSKGRKARRGTRKRMGKDREGVGSRRGKARGSPQTRFTPRWRKTRVRLHSLGYPIYRLSELTTGLPGNKRVILLYEYSRPMKTEIKAILLVDEEY